MKTMITSSLLLLLAAAISLLLNNNAAASKDSSSAAAAITNNVDVTIATELFAATDDTNSNANNILAALTAQTNKTTQSLSQKSAEYTKLQSLLSDKLAIMRERQSSLQAELNDNDVDSNTVDYVMGSTEAVHESMDDVSLKLLALIQRTEDVMRRVGQFNRAQLLGSSDGSNNNDNNHSGLQERLANVKKDEIERRDRFLMTTQQQQQESSGDHDDSSSLDDDESHTTSAADVKNDYMTITQLDQLLSTTNILTPSENELKSKLTALAINMMEQRTSNDADFWKNHFATLPRTIQEHVQHQRQQQVLAKSNGGDNDGECIQIPSAVQLVANTLALHYQDGGVGMMDVASYENGGSVVYELTSSPYQPSPRNDGQVKEQEFGVDKATERIYHAQQHNDMMMMSGGGIAQKIDTELDKIDIWNWYTNFKMDSIRKYLPNDWERALDRLSSSGYLGTSTNNWGEYTPRGIVDAIIPDYIYHAFGISNTASYGSVYGRTASPEVAITAGYSKVGGGADGGGWIAKALGNCYPISMRPENDPVLSLLSRGAHSMGAEDIDDEEDSSIPSLVGPKYTVRLPYPIHIDAVSVEHRAFPLPQRVLNDGVRGGESAPRWVKVVGFPPCDDGNGNLIEADEEECDKLGFDISQPIELGSFEYHPVTVSGREDDYGGGDVEETSSSDSDSDRRRRSIQTFTVKGGKVNESDMEEKGSDDDILGSDEPGLEVEDYEIPAGSCAPPKEPDDVPSCGGDTSSSSDQSQSEREVVSAVSFIIEENWGNNDYTCLYRVRVHGEPISI